MTVKEIGGRHGDVSGPFLLLSGGDKMIPVSVSDLLKILDQIPVWKSIATLPRRLAALEARIEALESAKSSLPPPKVIDPAKACPMCGTEMKVVAESDHPTFHFAGVKIHQMTCPDCNYGATRNFNPGKGYQ
jgi:hypothetical protein